MNLTGIGYRTPPRAVRTSPQQRLAAQQSEENAKGAAATVTAVKEFLQRDLGVAVGGSRRLTMAANPSLSGIHPHAELIIGCPLASFPFQSRL